MADTAEERIAKKETCVKRRVLLECKVVVEPGPNSIIWYSDQLKVARQLEEWAKELYAFLRDHRSIDVNGVEVVREYQEQCSACGHEWEECEFEPDGDDPGYTGCAYCGKPMEIVR